MAQNKTLKEEIVGRLDREDNKLAIATSIIDAVKKGDKSALNLISKLIDEKAQLDLEAEFPLSDEQFKQVILLYADRVRSTRGAH